MRLLFSQFRIPQHTVPLTLSTRKAQNKPRSGKYLIKPLQNRTVNRPEENTDSYLGQLAGKLRDAHPEEESQAGDLGRESSSGPPELKGHRVRLWEGKVGTVGKLVFPEHLL